MGTFLRAFAPALAFIIVALMPSHATCAEAPKTATITVAALKAPAEILIDRWGVPHIYAKSEADVYVAQGVNAARDRLFQIDLWRRRGLGQLAEVFGPAYVEQDKATRLFLYRGDMDREWRSYSSKDGLEAKAIATSFVAGINAYVDYVAAHPEELPWEFTALAYAPAKWSSDDVVRIRSHGLTRNLSSEVARANVTCQASVKDDEIRFGLQPPWDAKVPDGLDPCLPKDVLKVFNLATQNVRVTKESIKSADAKSTIIAAADQPQDAEGSNNWVIAPRKSATGRAIMANDPHRAYSAPSLRYITHLSAPGLNVIGAGEPALPGISIGHNGTIAFGLTIFNIDQEDLYSYELDPAHPDAYRYGNGWEPFKVLREEIKVKGAPPVLAELKFTRHGPVIYTESAKNRAFAVRSAWLEPGMSPYFGSVEYMKAKSFKAFKQAMLKWGAPTENQVYADVHGNIGWVPGGLAPKRANWDGLLPVPGDGRYEWGGFWRGDQLPSTYNPPEGWFASANHMNLPPDYPYRERKLGFEWTNESRYMRLAEVLSNLSKVSLEDSMRLQNDSQSIPARRLIALIAPLSSADAKQKSALELLRGWDAVERPTLPQSALMEVWISRHLGKAFEQAVLPKAAADAIAQPDIAVMLATLEIPAARFGENAVEKRDNVLLQSLGAAYVEMEKLQGADTKAWQWGKLHHNMNEHALAEWGDDALRAKINVGPLPTQGSAYVPNQSAYRVSDFRQTNGPSFRVVIDVGHWDNSRAVNHPGQSGNPESAHYRDLARLWSAGEYFPLLYSRRAIEAVTETRIALLPRRP